MTDVCKFKFHEKVGKKTIEKQIARAIETAEYAFGQAKVRLHAGIFGYERQGGYRCFKRGWRIHRSNIYRVNDPQTR